MIEPWIITIGGGLILLVLVAILAKARGLIVAFFKRNFRLSFRGAEKCRGLIFGLGRSGKTTIIKNGLTFGDTAARERSTQNFDIYEAQVTLGLGNSSKFPASIADYKGQQPSQLIVDGPAEFTEFFGRNNQRLINSVIFVVDLFPELRDIQGDALQDDEIVAQYASGAEQRIFDRVADHKEYLTRFIIQMIFSLAFSKEHLFIVSFLINKVDLLERVVANGYLAGVNDEKSLEEYAKNLFAPISDEIERACQANGVNNFSLHLVSGQKGTNIRSVFSEIFEVYNRRRP